MIRIAVQDIEASEPLVQDFVGLFGGGCVSLGTKSEIEVHPQGTGKALVEALRAVERWLEKAGLDAAKVWVDEHSYVIERPRIEPQAEAPSETPTARNPQPRPRTGVLEEVQK